ncbi:uncharacterized protein Bfra_000491 [Botrytis fragariae]|uniref:Uncharacterized protein n=1 Tax=Botrytis fragariae TaxID=1964551 RepID=A0A8H6ENG2_9HELO|nr:uncharacterized protein Bfra_000491 [Botrytis fragariae]KAF5878325.1 hypothetical protein Bfra_000491 [Botrytis fragariae]
MIFFGAGKKGLCSEEYPVSFDDSTCMKKWLVGRRKSWQFEFGEEFKHLAYARRSGTYLVRHVLIPVEGLAFRTIGLLAAYLVSTLIANGARFE